MGVRVWMLVLFMVGMAWACDARKVVVSGLSEKVAQNEKVCTLCEQYVTVALDYLDKNETQAQITEALHERCSQLRSLKQQCISLVDYYVPLFFLQIETLQPEDFCRRVNLCEKVVALAEQARQNTCDVCHQTASEILVKLQDPDTQLDIIETLLKGCKTLKNFEKQCKKLVFEYGPVILVNAEDFLVQNDVCVILHACPAKKISEMFDVPAVADS